MSLNDTPSGERIHIGFFGMRNAGKSSLVNAVTGQDLSVVSDTLGTTTDPVKKAMELLPLGPVVIIDTPGIDDEGELGNLRVQRSQLSLARCDLAVLVVDGTQGMRPEDDRLAEELKQRKIPYVIAWNKADELAEANLAELDEHALLTSAANGTGIHELKERLGHLAKGIKTDRPMLADLISAGDVAVLVIPIDSAAPKGRIILPQQMVLREVLDCHASALVCQVEELQATLESLKEPPRIVVTDSQAFGPVSKIVDKSVQLTSFSILMARHKGELAPLAQASSALDTIQDGDKILISEGCTHHRQCDDIGTVKIPRLIRATTQAEPIFEFSSGNGFPQDLTPYKLIVHCGACMLNEKEMDRRYALAREAGVPLLNYGMALAKMHGILDRALTPFQL